MKSKTRFLFLALTMIAVLLPFSASTQNVGTRLESTALNGTRLTYYQRPNMGQCEADCVNNPRCKGYTWIQAGTYSRNDPAMCYLMAEVTGQPAVMWGPSIVGFGRYHYRYASGREGDFLLTGFSPRKANLAVYILPGYDDIGDDLARLGKHKVGKSCLSINRLADVDLAVLEKIVADGVARMRRDHETWDI